MLLTVIIFILALGVVVKGADHLVTAAERTAKLLGVSELTIGLTMVAVGTSMPELVTSVASAIEQHTSIAAGTIIGSNITDMGLLLGVSSLLLPMDLKKKIYHKDTLILLFLSILWFIFAQGNSISRVEGIILILFGVVYVYHLIKRNHPEYHTSFESLLTHWYRPLTHHLIKKHEQKMHKGLSYTEYQKIMQDLHPPQKHQGKALLREIIYAIFALIVIFIGTKYLISSTIDLAQMMHIPEEVIAMSVIAFGTSVPEIMVSIAAARKKLGDLLIGNIVGSNIMNIVLVGGITASISPITISSFDLYFAIPVMILMTILFLRYLQTKWFHRTLEGVILLAMYLLFLAALVLIHTIGATKVL